ncbi:hypothetical protein FUA26_14105 [Seonamhaeicola algicola]|uniref:Novel STAND NTPase 3 domain-containing protein n=1 Tax=Seonamhaeicola algicola TaxID=1719036 RepID=A0A5C7ABD3_9FLAO|nr:hypothetical protein [Seonamhaeicola algicola]TXE06110.1 hypothetical protein FUA26_14105 [Seonamhaeicola algicola]
MLTQIEQALIRCNSDKYANLCRLYLSYRYNNVIPTGFVLGKEKSKKGTPDNFIPIEDYYIFNEVTTQKERLKSKLKKDIEHCFKQEDIPKQKIVKIILMCNSEVSASLFNELSEYKNTFQNSTKLEVIDLADFSNHIHRDYPSIARELNIPIDTGQILEVKSFINQYEKSKFATTLSNDFFNRKEDLDDGIQYLKDSDILLISGIAGIGKTKFSLELSKRFKDEFPEFHLKYIINNGCLDIWEDLKVQLIKDRNYLIVLDDANKLKANLELILNFIKNEERKGKIKLILTVRNYVKEYVQQFLKHYKHIELKEFEKSELAQILQSPDFKITNYYVDRIYSISKGNPRIAIMAAIAGINKEIEKLNNASEIYEEYFSSVKDNIETFGNENLLKTAGIISLFRVIDFDNESTINEIEEYFEISKNELIENLRALYKLEITNEFKNAYKIADQILGEYIFYLVFINEQKIPFYKLLKVYVEKRFFPLSRILVPIVSNYGFESVKNQIVKDIKTVWNEIYKEEVAIRFLDDFWYYLTTEALIYLNKFERLKFPKQINEYPFKVYDENHLNSYKDKRIDILVKFENFHDDFNHALAILHDYGLSNETLFTKLLKVYTQSFTYGQFSYEYKYRTQINLFDFLYSKIDENPLFYSRLILFIAPSYLIDSYRCTVNYGNKFAISMKPICLTEEQKRFRTKLWEFIFNCYKNIKIKNESRNALIKYVSKLSYHDRVNDVIEFDMNILIPFIEDNFNKDDYTDNSIVDRYTSKLRLYKIKYKKGLEDLHCGDLYNTFLLLSEDKLKRKDFNGDYDKYEEYKEKEVEKFIADFSLKEYYKLLDDIDFIYKQETKGLRGYFGVNHSFEAILKYLHKKDFHLFLKVLKKTLQYDFCKEIAFGRVFSKIEFDNQKIKGLRNLLKSNSVGQLYLNLFWNGLSDNELTDEDYLLCLNYIKRNDVKYIWFLPNFLEKASNVFNDFKIKLYEIFDIVIERINNDKVNVEKDFFLYLHKNHFELFNSKIEQIKHSYLILDEKDRHFDYDLKLLKLILNDYPSFITDLLKNSYDYKDYLSRRELSQNDFTKLLDLSNYEVVMYKMLEYFKKFDRFSWSDDISTVFKGNNQREENVLKEYLISSNDESSIAMIYNIVVNKYRDKKFDFLKLIIDKNISTSQFNRLGFYPEGMISTGSRIPKIRNQITELQKVIDYLKSLNDLNLLEFVNILDEKVIRKKSEIEREIKEEFIRDWGL